MMLITPRIAIGRAKYTVTSGKIGKEIRIRPYVPIFRRTPARMTEMAVGASTWASGSHVWNGKSGTLMAKPMNRPRNRRMRTSNPFSQALCVFWDM